jgi:hypothetical protein
LKKRRCRLAAPLVRARKPVRRKSKEHFVEPERLLRDRNGASTEVVLPNLITKEAMSFHGRGRFSRGGGVPPS